MSAGLWGRGGVVCAAGGAATPGQPHRLGCGCLVCVVCAALGAGNMWRAKLAALSALRACAAASCRLMRIGLLMQTPPLLPLPSELPRHSCAGLGLDDAAARALCDSAAPAGARWHSVQWRTAVTRREGPGNGRGPRASALACAPRRLAPGVRPRGAPRAAAGAGAGRAAVLDAQRHRLWLLWCALAARSAASLGRRGCAAAACLPAPAQRSARSDGSVRLPPVSACPLAAL